MNNDPRPRTCTMYVALCAAQVNQPQERGQQNFQTRPIKTRQARESIQFAIYACGDDMILAWSAWSAVRSRFVRHCSISWVHRRALPGKRTLKPPWRHLVVHVAHLLNLLRDSIAVRHASERSVATLRMCSGMPARRAHSTPKDSSAKPSVNW